jgi:hypothetical protein
MREAKHITSTAQYASSDDFYKIFYEEKEGLHLLSYMLTGDQEKAEECFVAGLEDAVQGNRVFKAWARSWARRVIIKNAVHAMNPWPVNGNTSASVRTTPEDSAEVRLVLTLGSFERFVYVMSVLEHYSDPDCSLLLGCSHQDVIDARNRASQQIGSEMDFYLRDQLSIGPGKRGLRDNDCSVLDLHLLHSSQS